MRVGFSFTAFSKDSKVWKKESTEQTFKSVGWGWPTFIPKSNQFRTLLRNGNDRFTGRCVLIVVSASTT